MVLLLLLNYILFSFHILGKKIRLVFWKQEYWFYACTREADLFKHLNPFLEQEAVDSKFRNNAIISETVC